MFRLSSLRHLSIDNNKLRSLPIELCALSSLEELHLAGNELMALPLEFGFLTRLVKLHLQKNKIRELPEVCDTFFLIRSEIALFILKSKINTINSYQNYVQ